MTQITEFSRASCRVLRDEIATALEKIGAEHGVRIEVHGGTFSPTSFRCKVEAACGVAADATQAARSEFELYAKMFGLEPKHFGCKFTSRGEVFEVTGLAPRRPKFPVNGIRVRDGKHFKFTVASVLNRAQLGG